MRAREEPSIYQVRWQPLNVAKPELFYVRAINAADARGEFIRWWAAKYVGGGPQLDIRDAQIALWVDGNEIINPERVP